MLTTSIFHLSYHHYMKKNTRFIHLFLLVFLTTVISSTAQNRKWAPDDSGVYQLIKNEIVFINLEKKDTTVIVSKADITPEKAQNPIEIKDYSFSDSRGKVLLFTNSKRVWRYETKGDYYILDLTTKRLVQIGRGLPASSLLFAKISPNEKQVAYVSEGNLYLEQIGSHKITPLTNNGGNRKLINGTFDWAYEEEFGCRDGFRWSNDSRKIAYWQIDATSIRDFPMINTTDSIYAFTIPIEYPKVGETPSASRIGVVDVRSTKTTWMDIPGDNRQHYIPRMEWADNSEEVMIQQLNRKQNKSILFLANATTGTATPIHEEVDAAWVDVRSRWTTDSPAGWAWINKGKAFLWISEEDGWRHIYKISRDGKTKELITPGQYDVISPERIDHQNGFVYFSASPNNATQRYLYRVSMDVLSLNPERITPLPQQGTHSYDISPTTKWAIHQFSNHFTRPMTEWVRLPSHEEAGFGPSIASRYDEKQQSKARISFFQVTTKDGVTLDGWMQKPTKFDSTKKYPVVFFVYGEPASQTVVDRWGAGQNALYQGDMAEDGYIYISVENRGAPAPKGREWRKSIYRKIGIINIRDQAMACEKLLEQHPYLDPSRVAVHGWSGGGSSTLNLLFQYPNLYQTGIAVAAVANQLTYDNIYQERYMGIPQENREDFIQGSPITHAKNLKGNLLYIHGTGDDNVHYQNAEMLVNELIKYNKQFQFMPYPNRDHGIRDSEATRLHLQTLFTHYLKQHCPPGAR